MGEKNDATTMENSVWLLKKETAFNPAFPLWVIYPKELKIGYLKGTCYIPMFSAALFAIAKRWN